MDAKIANKISSIRIYIYSLVLLVILSGLLVLLVLVQSPKKIINSGAATYDLGCSSIILNPVKTVYGINENIAITVKGYGSTMSDIVVWQMPAMQNLIQDDPYLWQRVTGSYNASTKTWTGTYKTTKNGEFIISPNIKQSNGMVCSSNPGYFSGRLEFLKGTYAWAGITPGTIACPGCNKTIAVSQNYDKTTGFDMTRYWNMRPGYTWNYLGVNRFGSTPVNFKTKIAIEEYVKICNVRMLPVRYTKNLKEGYIYPYDPTRGVTSSVRNLRFFLSYFEPANTRWSSSTMGNTVTKHYNLDTAYPYPLGNLGSKRAEENGINFVNAPFENIYYSPYFYSEKYMNADYYYDFVDQLYGAKTNEGLCTVVYNPYVTPRHFREKLVSGSVVTTAYSGPVLILRQIEGRQPWGSGWYIREDWYLAPDIGIVKIEKDNLNTRDCMENPDLSGNHNNCSLNNAMIEPHMTMSLKNYYVGGALSVSLVGQVTSTGYQLNVVNSRGSTNTGWLEARTRISETTCTPGAPFKWNVWVQDGVAVANLAGLTLVPGLRHSQFRPWIEKTPSDETGETRSSFTDLPWSNVVLIRH